MEKIKILLISDLHLGMEHVNPIVSKEERLNTFDKIISIANDHDIILIAGDLINDENIDSTYFDILNEKFLSLINSGKEIFYTPGDGELTSQDNINPSILKLNTTFTFSDDKGSMIKSSKGDIFIYGLWSKNPSNEWDIVRSNDNGFHIGLFYADFNPQINNFPDKFSIKKDNIKKMNLDFYALGKNHIFKMFKFYNKIIGAYPGSSESCSIDESGDRFVISMELEDRELQNIRRIAVNSSKVLSDEIDCGYIFNQADLLEKIKSSYSADSIIHITLSGDRDFMIESNFITEISEFFRDAKITDISIPSLNAMIEENIGNDSLKGIFFQILNEKIDKSASNKADNEILAEIIFQESRNSKSEGVVLCDF
ncbi:MAG: metallophosphoesterase [Spirochaetes bacterium]|nr:metallophosphoesterase [Spirochaetota bacterium]